MTLGLKVTVFGEGQRSESITWCGLCGVEMALSLSRLM